MLKIRSSTALCVIAGLFFVKGVFAQSKDVNKAIVTKNTPKATISFNLQKIPGIGPSGNTSSIIGNFDHYKNYDDFKAYPQVKNKPTGLRNVVEYYYIQNNFQLVYQTYCAGIYSKEYFVNKAAEQKWNLADTTRLSRKPIKCGISVMAGINAANDIVYIVDANNNGDFSDDVLRPVTLDAYNIDPELAVPVHMEYMAGNVVKSENILVLIKCDKPTDKEPEIRLKFAFPEFRYARFNYQGRSYFVCTDSQPGWPRITVMPDVPNFSNVSATSIKLNQFVHIGDKDLVFSSFAENGNKISFTGDDLKGFAPAMTTEPVKNTSKVATNGLLSSQVGFDAPVIKGYNINTAARDVALISTANLKGKYVFVDFWASYCGPCIAEFPNLKAAYDRYGRDKFEIVGVLNESDHSITERLISEGVMVWPTIKTDTKGTDITGYNINSYPSSYLINPEGRIVAVNLRGEELVNKLKALIK